MARAATKKIQTEGRPWSRYLRLSKAEAAEVQGKTREERLALTEAKLDRHLARITKWMDSQTPPLPYADEHVYRDPGLSAWNPSVHRPDWEAMLEAGRAGALAGIAVVAVDRYTRQVHDGEDLISLAEKVEIRIGGGRAGILDLSTYEGITMLRGMVQQAANESLSTSFRLRETLADLAASGKPLGGGRSYGFEVVGDKEVIEVPQRPEEVAVVREMATRMLAGEPLQTLAADLNTRGLTTTRGGPWTGANLGRLLGQARYGGLVELHGKIVGSMPGEPVLDRDTYDSVRALLTSRRRGRRPTGKFMLTGLLTCSTCQITMNGATRPKANAGQAQGPRIYRCPVQRGGCGRVILAEGVEEEVGKHMVGLQSDPQNVEKIVSKNAHLNEARAAVQDALRFVEKALVDLEGKKAEQDVIPAAYEHAKGIHDRKRAKLLAELDEFTPATAITNYNASADWDEMTGDEKRRVILDYRLRIEILAGQPGARRFDPSRVTFSGV